ncbi:MAG: exodeoxyribonuclease VII large subunit [Burkholderiaceae bacterium]|jgi:exodeoxyribonuclease VII large subunit|nr:exodeoxyribonuclease VII large subunit [Burkholderiaceae bacterium]
MFFPEAETPAPSQPVWAVGALCRAVAEALGEHFNPVAVRGEISGFTRAASGHCYFSLKDEAGQLRCAMFSRAAQQLDFNPREGDLVQARGRLTVYEPRGDLQLVVQFLARAGQGALFEQFLRRKEKLQTEGLFDAARKRAPPAMPRGIGLVTSPHAAALHDVLTALARRAPHLPVWFAPAPVQGEGAPAALIAALQKLYRIAQAEHSQKADSVYKTEARIDAILLVRGGGSIEDLWAFNDEPLARAIAASPVPVIVGVGHETDFTIADFVADLRAPTPTAAAELASLPRDALLAELQLRRERMARAVQDMLDAQAQRLDGAQQRLGRPSARLAGQRRLLDHLHQRLAHGAQLRRERALAHLARLQAAWPRAMRQALDAPSERLTRAGLRLSLLNPQLALARGYAWLSQPDGRPLTRAAQAHPGQPLTAQLTDGTLALAVERVNLQEG